MVNLHHIVCIGRRDRYCFGLGCWKSQAAEPSECHGECHALHPHSHFVFRGYTMFYYPPQLEVDREIPSVSKQEDGER